MGVFGRPNRRLWWLHCRKRRQPTWRVTRAPAGTREKISFLHSHRCGACVASCDFGRIPTAKQLEKQASVQRARARKCLGISRILETEIAENTASLLFRVETAKTSPLPTESRFWTSKLVFVVGELRESLALPSALLRRHVDLREHLLGTSEII